MEFPTRTLTLKAKWSIPAWEIRANALTEKLIIPDAAAPASMVTWNGAL
jgi:hypothetical protein